MEISSYRRDEVPKNVKAIRNSENPKRSVLVTFDHPAKGPASEYKIVAVPKTGHKRSISSKVTTKVMEYLRKGVQYEFYVQARWESRWSEGSPSNSIITDGDKGKALMNVEHLDKTTVDLTKAVLAGQVVEFNVSFGKDFGQVEDLEPVIEDSHDVDLLTLKWNAPTFDKKTTDHKVELYKVEIRKNNDSGGRVDKVEFERNRLEYKSKSYKLELGEVYQAAVSTLYLDIDQDRVFKSTAVKREVETRPCAPYFTWNDYIDGTLKIEWNVANGAECYLLELYVDEDKQASYRKDMNKTTTYKKEFNEKFGYGNTYYAIVTAISANGKRNSSRTQTKTIGGDTVPTNVVVQTEHDEVLDPNSQVFLSWTPPKKSPKAYLISSFPHVETMVASVNESRCLVSGLKAGTEYYFKVMAVHEENGKEKSSGGCSSKRIRTNPTPTQVKKVWTKAGENPSTSIVIHWEKVDAEKENETTKYRVNVFKEDETSHRDAYVENESVTMQDLDPGSTYLVTVAGGNSMGYGKDSEKLGFQTELGTPKNVSLLNNQESSSTSLIVKFSDAEGKPLKYVATMYKCTNKVQAAMEPKDVVSGHCFEDLEPNQEYLIEVTAHFSLGEGRPVKSMPVMTAPSRTKITNIGRTPVDGGESSREISVEWSSDEGCNIHEIQIICGTTGVIERRLLKENANKLKYSCENEAKQYSVRVRSRNPSGCFGDWSDEALIDLAPAKLQGVSAALEKEGCDILVKCHAAQTHLPRYFMRALRDDKPLSERIESKGEEVVQWKFTPPQSAQLYKFELWAEGDGQNKGESSYSNLVISKPQKMKFKNVKLLAAHPSTDIEVEWNLQQRCDLYEIAIFVHDQEKPETMQRTAVREEEETIKRTAILSYRYRCQVPGNKYRVSIRAIRNAIKGDCSDDVFVTLAPAKVKFLQSSVTSGDPGKSVQVGWEPLRIPPTGYLVKLFCNDDSTDEIVTTDTICIFEDKLKPGSLCYCTVQGFNGDKHKIFGKISRSTTYRIEWLKASYLKIENDENEPSHRAKMKWDIPSGVNCFKLVIENNQNGFVTTTELTETCYVFESGIPGNTYSVKLHCGCDKQYDLNYIQETMTMKPDPPSDLKVTANPEVNGLSVEFKDTQSVRKRYIITAQGLRNTDQRLEEVITHHSITLRDLVCGESYKVSVCTVIGKSRSKQITSEGYIPTVPGAVPNLCSKIDNGCVMFEWDDLPIKPAKYIVQWRVDNENITEDLTQDTSFLIFFLKPAHCYSARVMAANSSGVGPMSAWKNIITDPAPPYGVKVYPDPQSPETSLIVKYQDDKDLLKRYRIVAEGPEDEPKSVITHEHFAILPDLQPGRAYMVKVQTLFCGKESTWAVFSRISE